MSTPPTLTETAETICLPARFNGPPASANGGYAWHEPACLLGRMSADILERPRVGDMLVTMGWELARDGRKRFTASALLDAEGRTVARARATWVQLRT